MTSRVFQQKAISLILEDGVVFSGFGFGADAEVFGEVVFNTGMVGYPESFTDPSYQGQILVLTYPLIGNYGVPAVTDDLLQRHFESDAIHIRGLIVSEYSDVHHHWLASCGLSAWLARHGIPGVAGIDTRALTKKLRFEGTMGGRIVRNGEAKSKIVKNDPCHYVSEVSVAKPITYQGGKKRVALVDCGCKHAIIHSLIARGLTVIRVPWDFDVTSLDIDGVVFSNGPGDPTENLLTIETARKAMAQGIPTFGICLGNQILALAAGAKTYKLKFGHRSQNQPCQIVGTKRCYITSQNHGYAVDTATLPPDWEPWFENVNDQTNEGLRHRSKPFISVQFHPEATPGPVDTGFLFDEFVTLLR